MRLLLTASRSVSDWDIREIRWVLDGIALEFADEGHLTVVHGACHLGGGDAVADAWAREHTFSTPEPWPADQFGTWPTCGPRRNSHMVSLGADLAVAFPAPGSKGTWDCLRKAVDAKIPARLHAIRGLPS